MSRSQIDNLILPFYVPQYRRFEALIAGDGNEDKYSALNLAKGAVSWALRAEGAVDFKPTQGRTLRSGKVNSDPHPQLLDMLKAQFPNVKKLEHVLSLVLDELPHYNKISDGVAQVGPWDGTWFSDNLIPPQLQTALQRSATNLEESIPNCQKDWHYGGDKLVLNLVHPSLYCLNAETTRVLKKAYRPSITSTKDDYFKLLQHQITGDNSLNSPDVKKLLSSFDYYKNYDPYRKRANLVNYETSSRIHFSPDYFLDTDHQWLPSDVYVDDGGAAHFVSYINNLFDPQVAENVEKVLSKIIPLFERTLTDLRAESRKIQSTAKNGKRKNEGQQPAASLVKLRGRKIQMIVTMSNTILTPENPKYPGGRLHVDGMDNEQIAAIGIFYYSCENITESRLALSDKKVADRSFKTVSLGSIETKEGRCFVFPNNYLHQVEPFELADPTRPGHRKRLTFFLVDPSVSIISTARVPPQQKSWWVDQLKEIFAGVLPPEIVDHIETFCISPNYMELEAAREHRDNMAKRRTLHQPSNFYLPMCGD